MATNNIKIFDQNKANMLTDEAYNTSTQRLNGVQQGIASSQLQNKTLYQVSLVAYSIGQMMQANGLDANDANAVSTFVGNLSNTIVQKILDKATTTEAKNFTVNNKFITPQTWKAAYDFMKADSNMVSAATDDTHYITPKLLKEGAEKYGDKVRLDDGVLAQWKTYSKVVVNKCNINLSSIISSNINNSVNVMIPDKNKKYYFCVVTVSSAKKLVLVDYNTGEILHTQTVLEYDDVTYNLNISAFNISPLSENMFLCIAGRSGSNAASILAVDFSTGKFVVKNVYKDSVIASGNTDYAANNRTRYFEDDLYISFASFTALYIIHYNITSNSFNFITTSQTLFHSHFLGIAENGTVYIIAFYGRSTPYSAYIYVVDKDNLTAYDSKFNTYGDQSIYERNNILYSFCKTASSSNEYNLMKINLSNGNSSKLFTVSYIGTFSNLLMLVNEEETAVCINGTKYGDGEINLDINTYINSFIDSNMFGTAGTSIITSYISSDSYSKSIRSNIMKYKNEILCSDTRLVYDIEYAYFGTLITEIE